MSNTAIIAHRGYSEVHSENTCRSFSAAVELEVDYIEADVRRISDGSLAIYHYPRILPFCGNWSMSLAGQKVSRLSPSDRDALGLPVLSDLFEIVEGSKTKVVLDFKQKSIEFAQQVLKEVVSLKATNQTVLGVRSLEQLDVIKEQDEDVEVLGFLRPQDMNGFFTHGGNHFRFWERDFWKIETQRRINDLDKSFWVMSGNPVSFFQVPALKKEQKIY